MVCGATNLAVMNVRVSRLCAYCRWRVTLSRVLRLRARMIRQTVFGVNAGTCVDVTGGRVCAISIRWCLISVGPNSFGKRLVRG